MDKISIIVPCYNEEEALPVYYQAMRKIEGQFNHPVDWEYIFINDGSSDDTLAQLQHLSQNDAAVKYISFSRNFGKEAGLFAGLEHTTGNYIVIMDVDLQDPPELLPKMYHILKTEPFDCVGTRRITRNGEPPIRSFFAKQFYKLMSKISNTTIVDGARDYRMMTRHMVDAILKVTEYNRFSKGIFSWVGFRTKYLPYQNQERSAGQTSWNFWSLFTYSIEGIVSFSEAPLALASMLGFISFIIAIIVAIILAFRTLILGNPTSGWTSLIVVILGMGGLQLLCLGILGKYVGKTFLEAKRRPIYIIQEMSENIKNQQHVEQSDDL